MKSGSLIEKLRVLSDLPGAPGFEEPVVDYISEILKHLGVGFTIDRLGNLICRIKGCRAGASERAIHFDAHTDEPAFLVKYIDNKGMIYIATIGFFVLETIIGQRVRIVTDFKGKNQVKGTFCVKSVHGNTAKSYSIDDLWIDVGATSSDSAINLGIKPGNSIVFDAPFSLLNGGKRVLGKALDNRASCAILLEAISFLVADPPPVDVFFSFSAQEEFILRGAQAAFHTLRSVYQVVPKVSISLDIGICGSLGDAASYVSPLEMGKGPGIKIRDKSGVSHYSHVTPPRLVAILEEIAYNSKIPYQYDFLPGSTNADVFATQDSGVYAGGLSFAARNTHSPVEIADTDDLIQTLEFVVAIALGSEAFDRLP